MSSSEKNQIRRKVNVNREYKIPAEKNCWFIIFGTRTCLLFKDTPHLFEGKCEEIRRQRLESSSVNRNSGLKVSEVNMNLYRGEMSTIIQPLFDILCLSSTEIYMDNPTKYKLMA